jgi:hypothetical protein
MASQGAFIRSALHDGGELSTLHLHAWVKLGPTDTIYQPWDFEALYDSVWLGYSGSSCDLDLDFSMI